MSVDEQSVVVRSESGNGQEKTRDFWFSPFGSDEYDLRVSRSEILVGVDKPGDDLARRDDRGHLALEEIFIHPVVRKDKQTIVIPVGRFQGGKPVLIDAAGQKNIWDVISILDADPHRLNAGVVERHSEDSSALLGTEHSRADSNLADSLGSHLFKRV